MQIRYTNFDGDWSVDCTHCGNPQRDHQVDAGELDGIRYIHRQPCIEEQNYITKKRLIEANTIRIVVTVYEIGVYIWNKIPFKAEAILIFTIVNRAYVGGRGALYYWFTYRKRKR